jgi:DNA-binding transcriptional MocR family regulator
VRRTDLWRVPAPQGDEVLREGLAARLGLDPDRLTITASVRAAAVSYARRYADVLVERPGYPGVPAALADSRARVRFASWAELANGGWPVPSVLWLTSPHRNPDGACLDAGLHAGLRRQVLDGHRVVVNSAYCWFGQGPAALEGADLVGSLHKLAGVSARIGWVHSEDYFAAAVPELLGGTPSRVWQNAWGRFLARGGLELLAAGLVSRSRAAAGAFTARMRELAGPDFPQVDGPHQLLELAAGIGEDTALRRLAGLGYAVAAGAAFGGPRPAVRVSFLGVDAEQATRFADAASGAGLLRWPVLDGRPRHAPASA